MNRNKRKERTPRGAWTSARVAAFVALAALGALLGACNLVVESATDQCTADADCAKFNNGSVCVQGLCVLPGSSSSSSSSGGGGGGMAGAGGMGGAGGGGGSGATCFMGTPTKDVEFFNACTDATCVEFDNCARLGLCNGAALPPLVAPPAP